MSRLAAINPGGYVRIQAVCEGSELPSYFIAKIFRDLVRAGLLTSAKGRGGGYALSRPPKDIRLMDIVDAIDGIAQYQGCVVGLLQCNDKQPCPQHEQFKHIRESILQYLAQTTLQDMSEALAKKLKSAEFQITIGKSD